jgi:lipoprotein NlpD
MLIRPRYLLPMLLLATLLAGCAKQQPPARVVAIKPTVKRVPPKHAITPQINTVYRQPENPRSSRPLANNSRPIVNSKKKGALPAVDKTKVDQELSWAWPAKGSILTRFAPGNTALKGIDIGGSEGTPVFSASDGEVVYSGNSLRGYGNLIIIKHNKNFLTAYAHNRINMVKEGERVTIGQRIAEMGQTGTDKVKLHFEVRYQGKPIDPQEVLPARK